MTQSIEFHTTAKIRVQEVTFNFKDGTVSYKAWINFDGLENPDEQMIINNTVEFSFFQGCTDGRLLEDIIAKKIGENLFGRSAALVEQG